jgi:hypothetical protein
MKRYDRFADFYPVYLAIGALAYAIAARNPWAVLAMPILATGLALIGHRFFQHAKPGVVHYPLWGMIGNWVMTKDVVLGKLKW